MIKLAKILYLVTALCIMTTIANADRGVLKKKANKVVFNINTLNTLRSSIQFNLKSGLNYKGSTVFAHQQLGNSIFTTTLVSYQKGNTVYILPYKQRVLIPEYSPASGSKLVIRSKK